MPLGVSGGQLILTPKSRDCRAHWTSYAARAVQQTIYYQRALQNRRAQALRKKSAPVTKSRQSARRRRKKQQKP